MPFDTNTHDFQVLGTSVFRPGFIDVALSDQAAGDPTTFGYKDVTKATGIKGLRYKDEATLMAVMAAYYLLADFSEDTQAVRDRTAVIVSSNFGNVDTVVSVAQQISETNVDDTSAMALPNASSNSISATLSILFQLRGVNLMLCNGDSGGEDGFKLARQLLASGRADRVMLVGAEVDNPSVRKIFPSDQNRFHGAAAVLIGKHGTGSDLQAVHAHRNAINRETIQAHFGEASGADGILRLILAHEMVSKAMPASVELAGQTWDLTQ